MKMIVVRLITLLGLVACQSEEDRRREEAERKMQELAAARELAFAQAQAIAEAQEALGESMGRAMGKVLKGFGTTLTHAAAEAGSVQPRTAESLRPSGVTLHRAKVAELGLGDSIQTYLSFEKPFSGELELRAYDSGGSELGRSRLRYSASASSAEYVTFFFDERAPLTATTSVELRPSSVGCNLQR